MALSRAIETCKTTAEQICCDLFAERFLGRTYKLALSNRLSRDMAERLIESLFAGHHYYVIARTRHFDEFLQAQLKKDPEQLVILGAGYDSRAYRLADRLQRVAIFEVDHPATSAMKQSRIRELLGNKPSNVTYVPVDFNKERLADRLKKSGYREGRRSVFLWEGVTPYLNLEAVDDVLNFIHSSSGPGSAVLFDYIVSSVLDGNCTMRGARNEFEKMRRTPEPLTFGIAEGAASSFLTQRGFHNVTDLGSTELKQKYFGSAQQSRYVKPWWRMVSAEVG